MDQDQQDLLIHDLIQRLIQTTAYIRGFSDISDSDQRLIVVRALTSTTASFAALSHIPKDIVDMYLGLAYEAALRRTQEDVN